MEKEKEEDEVEVILRGHQGRWVDVNTGGAARSLEEEARDVEQQKKK